MCLAQGPQGSDALRLEPAALRSRVKHSTTEPLRSPLASSEDPDEMTNAAFHQGLHCLLRENQISAIEIQYSNV